MRIANCCVNHMMNPLGFALGTPAFSWTVEEAAGSRAAAARVVVTSCGEPVADTGWTELDALGCHVPGLELAPRTRYEWTVSVRSDVGEEAASEPQWFETGKMDEPWQAQWLTCDAEEPRHPVFWRELALAGKVASARAYVCGLGLYELSVGGVRVSEERLAPGTTAYDRWLQIGTYDMTALLQEAAQDGASPRVEVALGNGWYKGRFGFIPGGRGWYGNDWQLIVELHVTYADGTSEVFGTDESWQVGRSNVTFSNIYDGEKRDDTLPEVASIPASLLDAEVAAAQTAKLEDRWSLPVVPQEELPVTLISTPAGEQVLDCGQNLAGTFRLRVHEPAGSVVRLQFGEVLQDGNFYRDNLRSAQAAYEYVSDGAEHVLEARFTYYGYRYAKVEGVANLDPADFTAVALYSDFDTSSGTIVTGHAGVNRLVENARWGMRGNFVDTATDCPQRDERMGWTGDAQVFSPTALLLGKPYAFYAKYLHDMEHEQRKLGGMVPMVIPAFMLSGTTGVWGDSACIIPWNMYQYTGDAQVLEQAFDQMAAWVDYVERTDGDDHAWGSAFQLGDWLALDNYLPGKEEREGGTDEGFIAYAYYMNSALIVAQAADVLGNADAAARYRALAEDVRAYINAEYFSPNGRCCVDTQTAQLLTMRFGLGPDAAAAGERADARLQWLLDNNNGALATGFVGTTLLCDVLSERGHSRRAYDLLLNEGFPGWLYAVKLGATTIWERWNSLDEDGHISGTGMNSLNHYSYGSIVEWIWSHAAGLRAIEPGFRRAVIAPEVSWRLGELDARLDSAVGAWRVFWRCVDEKRLRLELTVPFGAEARLVLPLAPADAAASLGEVAADGGVVLGPGSYEVEYETVEPLRRVPSCDWTVREVMASRDTMAVLKRFMKHPEMTPADALDKSVWDAAPQMSGSFAPGAPGLSDEKTRELDAALRELAEEAPQA